MVDFWIRCVVLTLCGESLITHFAEGMGMEVRNKEIVLNKDGNPVSASFTPEVVITKENVPGLRLATDLHEPSESKQEKELFNVVAVRVPRPDNPLGNYNGPMNVDISKDPAAGGFKPGTKPPEVSTVMTPKQSRRPTVEVGTPQPLPTDRPFPPPPPGAPLPFPPGAVPPAPPVPPGAPLPSPPKGEPSTSSPQPRPETTKPEQKQNIYAMLVNMQKLILEVSRKAHVLSEEHKQAFNHLNALAKLHAGTRTMVQHLIRNQRKDCKLASPSLKPPSDHNPRPPHHGSFFDPKPNPFPSFPEIPPQGSLLPSFPRIEFEPPAPPRLPMPPQFDDVVNPFPDLSVFSSGGKMNAYQTGNQGEKRKFMFNVVFKNKLSDQ